MSTETNKALLRRATEECWNQGNIALIDELASPDFVNHDPARPTVCSREDYKQWAIQVRSAYPDLHYTIEDMIAEGEQVAMRLTFRGTNTGDIVTPMPIPATGKQVTMTEILIVRVASGKVVELWSEADYLGGYQQLGLIRVP